MKCHIGAAKVLATMQATAGSAREISAAVNEGENADEEADGGHQQDKDCMAQRFAARRGGRGGALVTHRAALGRGAGHRHG